MIVIALSRNGEPTSVTLTHCPKCRAVDRDEELRLGHYDHDYRCTGVPERHEYRLTRMTHDDYEGDY